MYQRVPSNREIMNRTIVPDFLEDLKLAGFFAEDDEIVRTLCDDDTVIYDRATCAAEPHGVAAGLLQHPASDRHDQARGLGHRQRIHIGTQSNARTGPLAANNADTYCRGVGPFSKSLCVAPFNRGER